MRWCIFGIVTVGTASVLKGISVHCKYILYKGHILIGQTQPLKGDVFLSRGR